jgi:hypothetical protein
MKTIDMLTDEYRIYSNIYNRIGRNRIKRKKSYRKL